VFVYAQMHSGQHLMTMMRTQSPHNRLTDCGTPDT